MSQLDSAELFRASSLRFADYYRLLAEQNKEVNELLAEELENLFSALIIYQNENAWSNATLLVHDLDIFLDGMGYWDALYFWLETTLKHAREVDKPKILIANTLSLAHLASTQGNRKKSIEIYREGIEQAEKNGDMEHLAQAYYGLGTISFSTGEFELAREHWQNALRYANECADGIQIAIIKYNLSLLDRKQAVNEPSEFGLQRATDFATSIFSKLGVSGIPINSLFRASTLLQLGKDEEAKELFQRVLKEFDKGGEKQGEALVLYNLGLIAQRQDDLDTALHYYQRSLQIASSLKDQTGLLLLNSSIGMTYLQMRRYDLGRPFLEESNKLLQLEADEERLADNFYWLGYAFANTGDLSLAENAFQESKSMFSKLGSRRVDDVNEVLLKVQELLKGKIE